MTRLVIGNWKMNGSASLVVEMVPAVAQFAAERQATSTIVICPPFTLLAHAHRAMQGSFLELGAQDLSHHPEGPYTGEVSAAMLKEMGARYVIIGHSERRQHNRESDALIRAKAELAMECGIIPVICVGETLEQRTAGKALGAVARQLTHSLPVRKHWPPDAAPYFVLAYEPVWAIGSGQTPTVAEIAQMHASINAHTGGKAKILYGGSVKASNAAEIMEIPKVSGVLVGGASLNADEFCGIIAASEG